MTAFFATAAKGTEGALRDELRELRTPGVRADRGGVHFEGEPLHAWRVCLWSRIAMRVLWRLGEFEAPTPEALYEGIRAIDWSPFVSARHTVSVSATCRSSAMTHTQFIAQKTKDALVDQVRAREGARPSVDLRDADLQIAVHLVKDHAQVYADVSGEPLHRRGYRVDTTEAPLKETLAAAILRLVGWDREQEPLIDPMCGSGTFGIEAAMWARDLAPGLTRPRFGFERWPQHDATAHDAFVALREEARTRARTGTPPILVSDANETAVASTRTNARAAGVAITVQRREVRAVQSTVPPGLVVVNPPYGERLPGGGSLFREMAQAFERLERHRIAILAGTPAIEREIRPRYRAHTLFNGNIECRLLTYTVP